MALTEAMRELMATREDAEKCRTLEARKYFCLRQRDGRIPMSVGDPLVVVGGLGLS